MTTTNSIENRLTAGDLVAELAARATHEGANVGCDQG